MQRLWSSIDKDGAGGCWVWTGSMVGGFPNFTANGRTRRAHRVVYTLLVGAIPERTEVARRCLNPMCVNPAHMELVTKVGGEAGFWSHVDKSGECWEWQGSRSVKNYGSVGWHGRTRLAHRVAWLIANGPIPEGMFVCHHCDNPPCVRPDHLFIGTAKDNTQDMETKGRRRNAPLYGADHWHASLTWDDAFRLRRAYETERLTFRALGKRFNVSEDVARKVALGLAYQ